MTSPQSSIRALFLSFISLFLLSIFAPTPRLVAQVATQQLVSSPHLLRFGQIALGQSEAQPVVVTNFGSASVTISAISMSDSVFNVSGIKLPSTLAAGQSVSLNVIFAPTQSGGTNGVVTFTNASGNPEFSLPVEGTGVEKSPSSAAPAILSFGQVPVGTTVTLPVVLSNLRGYDITLRAYQIQGSAFSVVEPALPVVIPPAQNITLKVTFKPQTSGVTTGAIFAFGAGLNIPVIGTGTTGGLSISPSALNFGSVTLGSTGVQPLTMSAQGENVTISGVGSSNSQFALAGTALPLTINAGQSMTLDVAFSPATAGNATGTLTFTTSASLTQSVETLSGTGASPQSSVSLSWNPSTSTVVGYNVYRGTAVGAYSRVNPALDSTTTYTDNTVVSGTTYYYAATAVNSSGQESGYSAPVKVSVQ
jgi:Abnormal spindle-like microcephaly-assoc'd, ASPM-SPD-2-Hydin